MNLTGQLTMEERIKFNVSRSISRQSIFPTLKREDRVKKMKAHLAKFNQDEKNVDLGYLQMSPHTTQVLHLLLNKKCFIDIPNKNITKL